MKLINTVNISFKSLPIHYNKELKGIKPNTVRILEKDEEELLSSIIDLNIPNTKFIIKIIDAKTNVSFERDIIDITKFKHGDTTIFIFSWKD